MSSPRWFAWMVAGPAPCTGRISFVERNRMRDSHRVHSRQVGVLAYRSDDGRAAPVRQLRGQRADTAQHAVHEHRQASHRAVREHGAMSRDPGNTETRANRLTHAVRKSDRLTVRNDRQLRRGAERPVGLRAEHPHALANATRIDTLTYGLDRASAVTVRDHPRERHRRTAPSAPLLRVTGIHSRLRGPNAHLASTRLGRTKLTDLEHLTRRTPCRSYHAAAARASRQGRESEAAAARALDLAHLPRVVAHRVVPQRHFGCAAHSVSAARVTARRST
jgi:hypothetical protein